MLKTTSYIIAFIFILGTACQPKQDSSTTQNLSIDTTATVKTESKTLDGYWILSDYIDSIFKDKAIAKHRMYHIAWSAMTFHIHADSLYTTGLLFIEKKIKINLDSDSLGIIKDSGFGTYLIRYNGQTDNIEATTIESNEHDKFKDKKYTYRRITDKRLLDILANPDMSDKKHRFKIQQRFNQLFIDSLIAGEYKSIDNGQKLTLTTDGLMKGFKKYNKYHIHDYFGTYHPFQNYDAICFEDTTVVSPGNIPPPTTQICYYNWTFSGDTLTLTEMMTETYGGDNYVLGKQTYKFIKTKKHSH